jgi:hypothetical protein
MKFSDPRPMSMSYLDALSWTLRAANFPILALGAALAVLVPGTLLLCPIRTFWFGWPMYLGLAGYYAVFLRDIMAQSMAGKDQLPGWPVESFQGLLEELYSILCPIAVAFTPFLAALVWSRSIEITPWDPTYPLGRMIGGPLAPDFIAPSRRAFFVFSGLWALGWGILPLLILAWPFCGFRTILHPIELARSALRTGAEYLLVVALTGILFFGAWAITLIPVPSFMSALDSYRAYGVTFLALVTAARVLGIFYHRNRVKLGWEREPAATAQEASVDPQPSTEPDAQP